ncbi:hypothetical protein MAR_011716 [Mya arenaria]|uniref:Uncharacterized protein n=1 Tax=Mya arenaria TaxID=6604 RepID=A0ABY7FWK4_MYAAR|nr:hypothetical protein MAR_011716 [Mya arenaria]
MVLLLVYVITSNRGKISMQSLRRRNGITLYTIGFYFLYDLLLETKRFGNSRFRRECWDFSDEKIHYLMISPCEGVFQKILDCANI